MIDIRAVVAAYLECALWSSSADDTGESYLDQNYDTDDFSEAAGGKALEDCTAFCMCCAADIEGMDSGLVGQDLWLTRNRHGAGFWDHGLGELGQRLTQAAHSMGSTDIYEGDDGKLHFT